MPKQSHAEKWALSVHTAERSQPKWDAPRDPHGHQGIVQARIEANASGKPILAIYASGEEVKITARAALTLAAFITNFFGKDHDEGCTIFNEGQCDCAASSG